MQTMATFSRKSSLVSARFFVTQMVSTLTISFEDLKVKSKRVKEQLH